MSEDTYRQTLNTAVQELEDLLSERESLDLRREAVDKRILKVKGIVSSICEILGEDALGQLIHTRPDLYPELLTADKGFTEAVRQVFQSSGNVYLSPIDVRDRLEKAGFEINNYRNVLASIHAILKRLGKRGELKTRIEEGKTQYKWGEHPASLTDIITNRFGI